MKHNTSIQHQKLSAERTFENHGLFSRYEKTPNWLNITSKIIGYISATLAVSTLVIAAAPTIIVSALPPLFAVALDYLTPMLVLIPGMSIAIGVGLGLLLIAKITEFAVQQSTKVPFENHSEHVADANLFIQPQ